MPSTSFSGVVSSFACLNLHHTTHRITPPQVARAVRGAFKHTRAAVSYDPTGAEQQTFVSSEGINQALLSSEDINQALFRDVGYGGRCQ
ncbi:hypothetical protein CMV_018245 [Castanea mollissima]|uniref:Uncharacterized protein n=1 Tax=Castanea mollissima TaxID=60419 RepID=A0A8J4VHW0_9ROSI|nr:hypothetical protein CMV_018245 [Castanea mollissima]